MSQGEAVPLGRAINIAMNFLAESELADHNPTIVGSIRRQKDLIRDIDIVVYNDYDFEIGTINNKIKAIFGTNLTNDRPNMNGQHEGMGINLFIATPQTLGAMMLHSTGPWELNRAMRSLAKDQGWKLNQYGLYDRKTDDVILQSRRELDFFSALGMPWVEPRDRDMPITLTNGKPLGHMSKYKDA